jgi:hypothetical protein
MLIRPRMTCARTLESSHRRSGNRRHGSVQAIAAARYGPDQALAVFSQGPAQLAHALRQRIVCDRQIRSDGRKKLVFRDQPCRIFDEVIKDREGLRSKRNLGLIVYEAAASAIENIAVKPHPLGKSRRWRPRTPAGYCGVDRRWVHKSPATHLNPTPRRRDQTGWPILTPAGSRIQVSTDGHLMAILG